MTKDDPAEKTPDENFIEDFIDVVTGLACWW